jgi:hypothetical protein
MSIEAGLIVLVAGFVAVWLVFVVYGEVAIARDRRREAGASGVAGPVGPLEPGGEDARA